MASPVIEVRGLRMSYGSVDAVSGIDLEVDAGEVFAYLGPNGAGNTTTVEAPEGFRHRTAGEVSVFGRDPARAGGEWRALIGVVLQESQPEPELTVEECVSLYVGTSPITRASGSKGIVLARYARNYRLADATTCGPSRRSMPHQAPGASTTSAERPATPTAPPCGPSATASSASSTAASTTTYPALDRGERFSPCLCGHGPDRCRIARSSRASRSRVTSESCHVSLRCPLSEPALDLVPDSEI